MLSNNLTTWTKFAQVEAGLKVDLAQVEGNLKAEVAVTNERISQVEADLKAELGDDQDQPHQVDSDDHDGLHRSHCSACLSAGQISRRVKSALGSGLLPSRGDWRQG